MLKKSAAAAAVLASSLILLGAGSAQAERPDADALNLHSMEACENASTSSFKFHIYYNSGLNGADRSIGYSVYDFNALRPGDGHAYPLRFCDRNGASSAVPGSSQKIKNNAAGGENTHYKYRAEVCFNSGYKGVRDKIDPYQHHDVFRYVYNENASFRWV
ncbi:hypothetical protein AB0J38_05180 [Streptomyces sp. NPDC050095]|uniref:hypothetical protein n=1 Tax=unclassified Streptomyces TaxID=2593676 RepID=UPI00343093B5